MKRTLAGWLASGAWGKRRWLPAVVGIALVLLPVLGGEFWVHVATEAAIMSLFALSFNLLFGYMGRVSFGQAAYFGVGGYAAVLVFKHTGLNLVVCMAAGILAGGLWALLMGYLCNRLSGIYFAIMTIVTAEATFYLVFQSSFTGGADGLRVRPPGLLRSTVNYYFFALIVVALAIAAFWFLVNSPFGRSLECIRDNPDKTMFLGIPVKKHMLLAFVIAGVYAAMAGALWAPFDRGIYPADCAMMRSGQAVFMAVLGGVHTFAGPVLGAVVWAFLNAFVSSVTEYWPLTIGLVLLACIVFLPGGLLGALEERLVKARTPAAGKGWSGREKPA